MIPVSQNKYNKPYINNTEILDDIDYDSLNFEEYVLNEERKQTTITIDNSDKSIINNNYTYKAINILNDNINDIPDFSNIKICPYSINTQGDIPFLQFLLFNYKGILDFPSVSCNNSSELIEKLKSQYGSKFLCKGFLTYDNSVYVFIDCNYYKFGLHYLERYDLLWLSTVDEIMNTKKMCNLDISVNVEKFFNDNLDFIFLTDKNDNVCETPIIAYNGMCKEKIEFTSVFGITKKKCNETSLSYYCFTDYKKAIHNGGWSNDKEEYIYGKKITDDNGKYLSGGIIRYALFLGNIYIPDKNDTSNTITDDIWDTFDSIYINNHLINNNILTYETYWGIKENTKYVTLTTHIIDRRTLGADWNRNDDYYIQ